MSILSLISSNNFIVLNKTLISLLGIEEALMLGELASEYDYWVNQGKTKDGWFFSTVENVERNTNLSKHRQKKALENLQKQGLVTVERKGMPAKRYIRINEDAIGQILSNKKSKILTSRSEKFELQEVKKIDRNKNKDNKNKVNNNKKESKKERKTEKLSHTSSKPDKPSISFDTLIENYTENEQLREELKEHLKTRKQKKAALTNRAVQLSLAKLDQIAADDYEKIKIVQNAIMNGWTGFFPLKPDEKKTMKKPNYDIEAYERSNRELFEAYPSGDNERRYKLDQFMNPKFNQNIIDLEGEDE